MADINRKATSNLLSSNNSTSTPLGVSEIFTGSSEEVLDFSTVSIAVYSDVASATDGLSIEFSTDGTNWDHTDVYTVPAATAKIFSIGPSARYFRVVYTNGTSAQSTFRLQSILRREIPKVSSHRIADTVDGNDDAELVKAILAGENSEGIFEDITTSAGRLLVSQEVTAPVNTTAVSQVNFQDVASTAGVDTIYTITNGKTLTLQKMSAGSEASTGGSITELFEDPNGDLSVLNRIQTIFTNGDSDQVDLGNVYEGDGTRRIVLRQRGYTSSAREMFARWVGFEE